MSGSTIHRTRQPETTPETTAQTMPQTTAQTTGASGLHGFTLYGMAMTTCCDQLLHLMGHLQEQGQANGPGTSKRTAPGKNA